jgi:methylamine---glutamate N-methyltransferase subunit A
VHNGSLSNPHLVRKKLEPLGIEFETDNDTEAACRFFEWRLREGDDLKTAVQRGFSELDGFLHLPDGDRQELLIVRDAFACKPAVVAETDDYVAIASEFRSLAHLPDIAHATCSSPSRRRSIHGEFEAGASGAADARRSRIRSRQGERCAI